MTNPLIKREPAGSVTQVDPSQYLLEYLTSIENLAPEMNYLLKELRNKNHESEALRKQANVQQTEMHRRGKLFAGILPTEEAETVRGIRHTFEKAKSLADESYSIASKALSVLTGHMKRLDADLASMGIKVQKYPDHAWERLERPPSRKRLRNQKYNDYEVEDIPIEDDEEIDLETLDSEEQEDEDNRLYCICNDVSHGDMTACDNPKCQIEWFHNECVGLKEPPKGKWYCPICAPRSSEGAGRKRGWDGVER